MSPIEILTIGHSNHALEKFLQLLKQNGVSAVADVRSVPYSRMHRQFDRENLSRSLKTEGIAYSFVGDELGGRPRDRSCYENGQVQYQRVAQTETFKQGIQRIFDGAQRFQIALMCSEREPLECHRGLLLAPELEKMGVSVAHIRSDGSAESHAQAVERLLLLFGSLNQNLFLSRTELIEEAYARQQARVAYVRGSAAPGRAQVLG